jgi:hypothetical protein
MKIDTYEFGSMTVDGKIYNADLIIFPDKIKSNWWRKEGHSLALEDLVVGRGFSGCMKIPPDTKKVLQYRNIQIIDNDTGQAYRIFNEQISRGKKVVGAFHLTC